MGTVYDFSRHAACNQRYERFMKGSPDTIAACRANMGRAMLQLENLVFEQTEHREMLGGLDADGSRLNYMRAIAHSHWAYNDPAYVAMLWGVRLVEERLARLETALENRQSRRPAQFCFANEQEILWNAMQNPRHEIRLCNAIAVTHHAILALTGGTAQTVLIQTGPG